MPSKAHCQLLVTTCFFQVLKEAKVLVYIFMVQNVPQVAFCAYLIYMVS